MRPVQLLLLAMLLLLAACGDDAGPTTAASDPDPVAEEGGDDPGGEEPATPQEGSAAAEETAGETTQDAERELPVTVTDADGFEVTIEDASRIVSLTGTTTEVIHALGLLDDVVAVDTSSIFPEQARDLPDVGYQRALNAEGVIAMDPTVVIGTEAAGPPEVIDQLRDSGVPVVRFAAATSLDAPGERIRDIATALGVPDRGEELAAEVEAGIAAALARAQEQDGEPRAVFIYFRGPETMLLGGAGTVSELMLEAAGAVDAGAATGIEGTVPLTPEALAEAAPEVIVVPAASLGPAGGVDGILELPGVAQTPAGEAGRVVPVDDGALLGLGPRTHEALEVLITQLHGTG